MQKVVARTRQSQSVNENVGEVFKPYLEYRNTSKKWDKYVL